MNIEEIREIDRTLSECRRDPLKYINPVNAEAEKEVFLSNRKDPFFIYRGVDYSIEDVMNRMYSLDLPDSDIGEILFKKREDMANEHDLIKNRGLSDQVKTFSLILYGEVKLYLVEEAEKILRETPNITEPKTVTSDVIKESLEQSLAKYGLRDWNVEFSNTYQTIVLPDDKKITICKNRIFTEKDVRRLGIHEIGVHVVRAANGFAQPLQIFGTGLSEYLPTEEGLTSYFEELTGTSSSETLREYAARVIAADSARAGHSFGNTFDRLKSFNLTDNHAWNLSLRVHRAGGFIKDHVYLQGLFKIREFAEENGDFKTLFAGKIGIEDLSLVKKLIQEGVLSPAKHIPDFL